MWDYEFKETEYGVLGVMPTGEEREFATENDYWEAYREEENEIIDEMADWYESQLEYPEDWSVA